MTARENSVTTNGTDAVAAFSEGAGASPGDDAVGTDRGFERERPPAETRPDSGERSATVDRDIAVSVTGLSKRFGAGETAVTAVDDVSVDIETGSIVGLLGPNGAGKTTLIKSILGMVVPDAGSVRIRGIDLRERPRAAYSAVDAMLEGARNDYWRLTVRENLRYFATISGVDPNSVRDRHDRLLAQLDLEAKADVPVRDLSRGMKQKVSLASVLAGGAEVVFLDEPTLGLDIESSRTLQRELRRLAAEEDLTVVLSSHDMDVVETVCDRVLIMSDGEIIADDTVDALLSDTDRHCVRITSADIDAALVSRLRRRFESLEAERRDAGHRIEVVTDSDGLYELLERLRDADVTLERVRTVEPDLEDVFVELTSGDRGGR
ncbi:ABC transporter-related protein [Natrinema pellirubrum DSM 15624]|uniref:ABC transporter-related protein n=1 Tax=Natrinema pellirubrum (strain DSM 15624 / CIP 106293 / JCM 10476 / NCIMB 786 / 157) TaxID=797303 RepID=L0JGF4_NATP1|nr:ABC transporter ATP-binding protein [Natrinema pellirubrum]AGB30620.1 ABC-type multidrug transport system, ATPase component [Natrinema pellirubrum DSM 15624]ELY74905.1 ABC transporter-related protein [Natrinema pellirubrum DSM 15624]